MVTCPRHTYFRILKLENVKDSSDPFLVNNSITELASIFTRYYKKYREQLKKQGVNYEEENTNPQETLSNVMNCIRLLSISPITETITDEANVTHSETYYPPEKEEYMADARMIIMDFNSAIRDCLEPTEQAVDESFQFLRPEIERVE